MEGEGERQREREEEITEQPKSSTFRFSIALPSPIIASLDSSRRKYRFLMHGRYKSFRVVGVISPRDDVYADDL